MKNKLTPALLMVMLVASLLLSGVAYANTARAAGTIAPIVSTDWLEANSSLKNLVILDIRSAGDYEAGHIADAINVPFGIPSAWAMMSNNLIMELPSEADLFATIGSCGITGDSLVVIVTTTAKPPNPPYPLADATRVADTLIYAGIKNVAILDGGYPKWVADGKPTTTEVPDVSRVTYRGKTNKEMFVSTQYVQEHIGRSVLIDARDADVYFGVTIEPFANKAGHIPTAKSLPTPWIWNTDGTYKQTEVLEEMASSVINENKDREIIVYCGVGGYASSWWFVLTQVLGYEDVKFYDGSAERWVKDNFMVKYQWSM